jgi:hypothetical protein
MAAGETELERMVVRLVGDGSAYMKMMQEATEASKRTALAVEAQSRRVEGFQSRLEGLGRATLGVFSSLGIATSLKGAWETFEGMERTMMRMESSIKAAGGSFEAELPGIQAFARTLSETTTLSRRAALGLTQHALAMGVSTNQAKQLVLMSTALQGATGQEAQSFLHVARYIQEGHPEYARRVLQLRGIKDSSELVTKIQQRIAGGLEFEQKAAEMTGVRISKLKDSFLDLTNEMGKFVDKAVRPVVDWLQKAVQWFQGLGPEVKQASVYFLLAMGALVSFRPALQGIQYVLSPLTSLFSVLIGVLGTFLSPWGLLTAAIVATTAAVVYFTGNGSRLLEWFGKQWGTLKDVVGSGLSGIKNALEAGDIQLAAQIAWNTIKLGFYEMTQGMWEKWNWFTENYKRGLNLLTTTVESWWTKAQQFISEQTIKVYKDSGWISKNEAAQALSELKKEYDKAQTDIFNAGKKRNDEVTAEYSKATKNIQRILEDLRNKQKELTAKAAEEAGFAAGKPPTSGLPKIVIPQAIGASTHLTHIQAAERGTSEALSRIAAAQDAARGMAQKDNTEDYVRQIRDKMNDWDKEPTLEVAAAGIG